MDRVRIADFLAQRVSGPMRDFTITGQLPLIDGLIVHTRIQQADERDGRVPGRVRMSIVATETGDVIAQGRAQGIWVVNAPGRAHEHVRTRDATVRDALQAMIDDLRAPVASE